MRRLAFLLLLVFSAAIAQEYFGEYSHKSMGNYVGDASNCTIPPGWTQYTGDFSHKDMGTRTVGENTCTIPPGWTEYKGAFSHKQEEDKAANCNVPAGWTNYQEGYVSRAITELVPCGTSTAWQSYYERYVSRAVNVSACPFASPYIILTVSPGQQTVFPNYNVQLNLTILNNQTFADTVNITCSGTCTYSQNPLPLNASQSITVMVTVATPSPAVANASVPYTVWFNATSVANSSVIGAVFANMSIDTTAWRDKWHDAYGREFRYRVPISITNSGNGTLSNYQINAVLDTASLVSAGKMRGDCGDLRFTNGSREMIGYWIESGCNTTNTRVWVSVPLLPQGISTIYTYYGSPVATSQSSFNSTFSIPGLMLWLKADAITGLADGTPVGTWPDSSGNGYNAVQATGSRQPAWKASVLNGRPALRFTASASQTINVNTNFPAPFTALYVARENGPTRQRVLAGLNNNWLLGWWSGAKRQAYFDGWVSPAGTPAADSNAYLYSATGTGSLSTVFENGNQLFSNAGGLTGPNGIAMGSLGNSEFSDADIAEIMIYNSALYTADRGRIEQYLASKYGLSITGYVSPAPTITLLAEEMPNLVALLSITPLSTITSPNTPVQFTLYVYNNQTIPDSFNLSCVGTCSFSENPVATASYQNKSVTATVTSSSVPGTALYSITATSQANRSNFASAYVTMTSDPTLWRSKWNDAYNNQFIYRVPITITNSGNTTLTNYPINFTIDTRTLINASKMQPNCADIRFTNGTNELGYWLESGCNATSTSLWVSVSQIPPGTIGIYLYYGNPAAPPVSNITNAYFLYDDFSGDLSKWLIYTSGNADVIIDSGRARLRVYRCSYASMTNTFNTETGNLLSFDWWEQTDGWCESRYVQVLVNGVSQPVPGFGGCYVYSGSGHIDYLQNISGPSVESVAPKVDASGPCGNADHGNTYLWVDNVKVRKTASPAPSLILGSEQKQGYRVLVRRCGLKQPGANMTAFEPNTTNYIASCLADQYGVCNIQAPAGTYDVRIIFPDNATSWRYGLRLG